MGSRAASNSSADERGVPRRCPWPLRTPPSSRFLSCLVLCTPFLSTVQTSYPAPHRPAETCSRPQAAPLTAHHLERAHTVFTRRVFVVWCVFFSFVCLQLLVLKPPTLRQLSQKGSKRERKGERMKTGKTRCLSVNPVRRPRVCVEWVLALPALTGVSWCRALAPSGVCGCLCPAPQGPAACGHR